MTRAKAFGCGGSVWFGWVLEFVEFVILTIINRCCHYLTLRLNVWIRLVMPVQWLQSKKLWCRWQRPNHATIWTCDIMCDNTVSKTESLYIFFTLIHIFSFFRTRTLMHMHIWTLYTETNIYWYGVNEPRMEFKQKLNLCIKTVYCKY